MYFRILVSDIVDMIGATATPSQELTKYQREDPSRRKEVNFSLIKPEELNRYVEILETRVTAKDYSAVIALRKFRAWLDLALDTEGFGVVGRLTEMVGAIRAFVGTSPNKWVFHQTSDGRYLPWYVDDIIYHKTKRTQFGVEPARVDMELKAYRSGKRINRTVKWFEEDMGKSVPDIFLKKRYLLETPEAVKNHELAVDRYYQLARKVGVQMSAVGEGSTVSDRWSSNNKSYSFEQEGGPSRVVLDDAYLAEEEDKNQSMKIDSAWWSTDKPKPKSNRYAQPEVTDDDLADLPIHPYLRVYDLAKYAWYSVHESYLSDYEWDTTLFEKLILGDSDKKLISILMEQTRSRIGDIVKGKMSGVIILATGPPGVGKTLTAEVFSEAVHRPIFSIQCSQLGLDVKEIEGNLKAALNLATRWGAILLIDEADVYIRERSEDILQNAIVGVFLRLLEYYSGILFMTSNRGEIVDDAIISRATAWIKYNVPSLEQQKDIWRVLSKQYTVDFTDKQIDEVTQLIGQDISGRTIRNLLKLARMHAGDGKVTPETINAVKSYQKLS